MPKICDTYCFTNARQCYVIRTLPVLLKSILNCRLLLVNRRSFINGLGTFYEEIHWD